MVNVYDSSHGLESITGYNNTFMSRPENQSQVHNLTLFRAILFTQLTREVEPMLILCWTSVVDGWVNINPLTAKLFNLNFHPLKVVSR